MHRFIPVVLSALALLAAACGDDDPVSHSEPVTINLKAKSGDVKNGSIEDSKGISTETANPYGAFIKNATAALGGVAPTRVELSSANLVLGGKSKGVTKLEDVFSGAVEVLFLIDDTNNTYKVGEVTAPTGSGPIDLSPAFGWQGVSNADYERLLTGKFKVVIRGPAAAGYDKAGAEADLQVTLRFEAFQ